MEETFDVEFHGNSESECTDFITAVRKYAKRNGKIRDNQWIADELYDAFRGQALKWYVCLPVDVRGDWELLQKALVIRWTTGDGDSDIRTGISSPGILPTPAAAPAASASNSSPSSTPTQSGKVGRVRIRLDGQSEVRYLCKDVVKNGHPAAHRDRMGAFPATTDATHAMKVRLIAAGLNAYRLELVEHESKLSVLAAFSYWNNGWNDAGCWGLLVGVDAPGQGSLKDRRTTYDGPDVRKAYQFWTERWKLDTSGRLELCGPGHTADTARFVLGVETHNKDYLWFLGPKTSPSSSVAEIKLGFEPLDG